MPDFKKKVIQEKYLQNVFLWKNYNFFSNLFK